MVGVISSAGIWTSHSKLTSGVLRPGLFLDRDGVLIEDVGYIRRPEDVRLMPGASELLKWARGWQIPTIVVSNQSGIARRLFGWPEFESVQTELDRQLLELGAAVDVTIACPFHPEFTAGYRADHAVWRKPGPGMLLLARDQLAIDLGQSWMIGDKQSDLDAALAAGLQGGVRLGSDRVWCKPPISDIATGRFEFLEAKDLIEAKMLLEPRLGEDSVPHTANRN